jgi:putative flippase GtrA
LLGARLRLVAVFVIGIKYAVFAVVSIFVNLLFQYLTFNVYSGYLSLYFAMFNGTLAGLICKYILDKKYIFLYESMTIGEDARKFMMYSTIGGLLTLVFWVFEIAFEFLFDSGYAKYAGAAIGLTIGYTSKYFLDRRFVFRDANRC